MAKIAILATGDEIINGDIVNTNGQYIARALIDNHITPGMHMVASDDQKELEAAMAFLLASHDGLITIGGLGPTSDDRTRFALANSINQPLEYDESSWNMIKARLHKLNLSVPESNKQQCYFPSTATILPNQHGTANGCKIVSNNQWIYMLPGPPNECLPMFQQYVISDLQESPLVNNEQHQNWLLFGVSEGSIAESAEKNIKGLDVTIGYRVDYPYLELKLHSANHSDFMQAKQQLYPLIEAHIISERRERASKQLLNHVISQSLQFHIDDRVTGGMLQNLLMTPESYSLIHFSSDSSSEPTHSNQYKIATKGLKAYWQQDTSQTSSAIEICIEHNDQQQSFKLDVPYRGQRMQAYATEIIALQILRFIA